jgi:hypothetical protein
MDTTTRIDHEDVVASERARRLAKLEDLRKRGIEQYPASCGRVHRLRLFVWLLVGLAVFDRSAAASSRMRGTPSPLARS